MGKVEKFLVIRVRVDRRHQPPLDSKTLVENLGNGSQAVCRTRRVGNDVVFVAIVGLVVNAETNGDVFPFCRRRDDDLLNRAAQVLARVLSVCKMSRRFHDEVDTQGRPIDLCRIPLFKNLDALPIDRDVAFAVSHFRFQVAENGIVFKKMCERPRLRDVVDGDNLDILVASRRTEQVAPDAPETIDAYFDSHYEPTPLLDGCAYSADTNEKVYSAAGMYITYTFVLALGLILTLPYYLVRFRKYLPTLPERFGFLELPQLSDSIWVHAVSVGEVKAVERLIEQLRRQFPGKPLVVSTATPAGQQLARERRDIIDHTFYFPIDLPFCVERALRRIDPHMVIVAETEIWPNFLRACRDRRVPVVMINGRISDRSFGRYLLVRRWLSRVFADYTVIGMQSEMDRERIQAIGADPHKVTVFGNLKYDVADSSRPLDMTLAQVLQSWKQVWIAASTLPGEEELVLDAFRSLRTTHADLKLVIAPRHADRFDAVEEIVRLKGFLCVRRSQLRPSPGASRRPLPEGEVLLLDTIGELASVFQYATVVFMGGSLAAMGGHNILEPARYDKPIVFGPHMENFRDIARLFLQGKAAIQIQNASELAPALEKILSNDLLASELGRNARAIVEQNTGATDRVLRFLQPVEARR